MEGVELKRKMNQANKQDGDYKPKLKKSQEAKLLDDRDHKKRPRRTHDSDSLKCPNECFERGDLTDSYKNSCGEEIHHFDKEEKDQGVTKKKPRKRNNKDDEFQDHGGTRKKIPRIFKKFSRFKESNNTPVSEGSPVPGGPFDPCSIIPGQNHELNSSLQKKPIEK